MRTLFLSLLSLALLSSCISTTHVHYSDPNYLNSDSFTIYQDAYTVNTPTKNPAAVTEIELADTSESEYELSDYYDYSYSSRIRRFHRPMYYSNYYGGIYTDYYWYNNDPFYCGTSIYYGYNWYSPHYSYYNYNPYWSYYSPYYFGNYYTGYFHNHHHYSTHNYSPNNSSITYSTGHRGSLSSRGKSSIRGLKSNAINNTIVPASNSVIRNTSNIVKTKPARNISTIQKTPTKQSTINTNTIRNTSSTKQNTYTYPSKTNKDKIKTRPKSNPKNNNYYKPKNNIYNAPKSNSRNYSSPSKKNTIRSYRSNKGSSGKPNNKSIKPRKK